MRGASRSERSDGWLDRLEDIREYDVPYHHRIAPTQGGGRQVVHGARGRRRAAGDDGGMRGEEGVCRSARPRLRHRVRQAAAEVPRRQRRLRNDDLYTDRRLPLPHHHRQVVSEDIADFEYNPKPDFPGPFSVFNEPDELSLLRRFCSHLRELQPHRDCHDNGHSFDWPYVDKRCSINGIDLKREIGFAASSGDNGAYFVSPCVTHIDCIHWVKRDSYLPAGSHGLKMGLPLPSSATTLSRLTRRT